MAFDHAEKIQGLLRKAEGTDNAAEAEAFMQKAQELMSMYAIDEAMLAHERDKHIDEIVRDQIHYHSTYSRAQFEIGCALAYANDCQVLVRKGKDLMHTYLTIIGFRQDVERVKLINASVQIQAANAMRVWYNARDYKPTNAREKFKLRREFLFSFAHGLGTQLALARERGRTEATKMHMARTGAEAQDAVDSVQMVLLDKGARVRKWMDEHYGDRIGRARATRFARGDGDAMRSGYSAGQSADASKPTPRKGISNTKPALTR